MSALAPVRVAGFVALSGTAVTGFEELSLESADTLSLTQNPALTDLDGLSRLEEVGELYIYGNDALVRMDLPQLSVYDFVSIIGNPALLSLLLEPAAGWAWTGRTSSLENVPLGFQRRMFEVGDNPRVTNITLTDGLDIEEVVIYRNASLASLSLPRLQRSDTLWLQDNAALASVEVPQLNRVSTLTIRNNPALSVAPFAGVQTFQSELTGNLDTLEP